MTPDLIRQFLRFGVVGVIGFVVDAGTLAILLNLGLGLGLYGGRVVSFLLAMTVTWALNRRFTFRDDNPEKAKQWARFAVVATLGGLRRLGDAPRSPVTRLLHVSCSILNARAPGATQLIKMFIVGFKRGSLSILNEPTCWRDGIRGVK